MEILVTAFGPFGGRMHNASSLALAALRKTCPDLSTRVLPVDAVIAPSRLISAIRKIQPDALLMLGEAGGSTGIRLETTAWNELDFRIPDIAGRQYTSRPIRPGAPISLPSTLPLADIHDRLISLDHPVGFSNDPGRYLCNQIFFRALIHLAQSSIAIPAGFIHLPLERDYPTDRAVAALSEVIGSVRKAARQRPPHYQSKRIVATSMISMTSRRGS